MNLPASERLSDEQRAVEEQIRKAFGGVTRTGGVSWSESVVIDNLGTSEQRAAAREGDRETRWEDLVDDQAWDEEPGIGGFNFLDPIGYAYYIAPAMIRCARRGGGEFVSYALTIDGEFKRDLVRLVTPKQANAIASFVRFMIATHKAAGDEDCGEVWQHAYRIYWKARDAGTPRA